MTLAEREAAFKALADLEDLAEREAAFKALADLEDPAEREAAFKALADLEDPAEREAAFKALADLAEVGRYIIKLELQLDEERAARAKIQAENERLSLELGMAKTTIERLRKLASSTGVSIPCSNAIIETLEPVDP